MVEVVVSLLVVEEEQRTLVEAVEVMKVFR